MAHLNDTKVMHLSENIIAQFDDDSEETTDKLYICDDQYSYIFNMYTANDLTRFFMYNRRIDLSHEILDFLIDAPYMYDSIDN